MQTQARDNRAAARRAGQPEGILWGGQINHNNEDQENIRPNINNITIVGARLDTSIPTILEVCGSDIKAKFPLQTITVIDDRPMYEKMLNSERESGKNALVVKIPYMGASASVHGVKSP